MHSLIELMWKQFKAQQSTYLHLRKEVDATRAEMAKVAERLELLRRLLALEGKEVELPPELEHSSNTSRKIA
jgi:hypothetical protein